MKFEWYKSQKGKAYISLMKYRMGFSSKLVKDMLKPKYVQLGYSDEAVSMAIKPLPSLHIEDNEYGIKTTLLSGNTMRVVSRGFIRFLISKGVVIEDKAKRYKAVWREEDKVWCVSLKPEGGK